MITIKLILSAYVFVVVSRHMLSFYLDRSLQLPLLYFLKVFFSRIYHELVYAQLVQEFINFTLE